MPVELFRAPDPVTPAEAPTLPPTANAAAGFSLQRAGEALPPGGAVLDVGCGGGAASLVLQPGHLVGVDQDADMLAEFRRGAQGRGIPAETVQGSWPAVAEQAGRADVVVCHHVLYNVADLAPFVLALSAAARVRVVCEVTAAHPWADLGPAWTHFHGQPRPEGPTADLAADALAELGLDVHQQRGRQSGRPVRARAATVAFARRRLCLPIEREAEVDRVLPADFGAVREVVTLWWETPGPPRPPGAPGPAVLPS